MLKTDSHSFLLGLHKKVWPPDLTLQVGKSGDTINGGLQQVVEEGNIINASGADPFFYFHFRHHNSKKVYGHSRKKNIAQKVVSLLQEGISDLNGGEIIIIEPARVFPDKQVSGNDWDVVK